MSRPGLVGLGIGVAAAGVAAAAGFATDRLVRSRRAGEHSAELAAEIVGPEMVEAADDEGLVVVADDGVPLHVEAEVPEHPVDGAPTVILTHGYAHNLDVWRQQRKPLADAGYPVLLWDLRGHGRSGEGDDASYTIDQLGSDLAAVIDHTVPEGPIVLVGHSMGGMAIMALAQERPELFTGRVVGIGLISTSSGGLAEVNYGLGRQVGAIVHRLGPAAVTRAGAKQELFNGVRGFGRPVESALVQRYSFGGPVDRKLVRRVAEMIFATRLHVIGSFLPTLMQHDKRSALAAFGGIETLIMHGTKDRMTPAAHGELLAAELPGAEYVVVEGAGHVLPMEQPQLVTDELLGLLERASRATTQDGAVTAR